MSRLTFNEPIEEFYETYRIDLNNFYFSLFVNEKYLEYRMHNGFLDIARKEIWEKDNPEIYALARAYYRLALIPVSSDDTTS